MDVTNEETWEDAHSPEPDDEPDAWQPTMVAVSLADWMIAHTKGHLRCVFCGEDTKYHAPDCLIAAWRAFREDGSPVDKTHQENARLKERVTELEDAAEAIVHWCSKRDQWWDEAVILADVLAKRELPDDPRAPGGIGYDGAPGPGPGE